MDFIQKCFALRISSAVVARGFVERGSVSTRRRHSRTNCLIYAVIRRSFGQEEYVVSSSHFSLVIAMCEVGDFCSRNVLGTGREDQLSESPAIRDLPILATEDRATIMTTKSFRFRIRPGKRNQWDYQWW